jgi:hypothetical protein
MEDSTKIQENPLIQQKYQEVIQQIQKDLIGTNTCGYNPPIACKTNALKYLSKIKLTIDDAKKTTEKIFAIELYKFINQFSQVDKSLFGLNETDENEIQCKWDPNFDDSCRKKVTSYERGSTSQGRNSSSTGLGKLPGSGLKRPGMRGGTFQVANATTEGIELTETQSSPLLQINNNIKLLVEDFEGMNKVLGFLNCLYFASLQSFILILKRMNGGMFGVKDETKASERMEKVKDGVVNLCDKQFKYLTAPTWSHKKALTLLPFESMKGDQDDDINWATGIDGINLSKYLGFRFFTERGERQKVIGNNALFTSDEFDNLNKVFVSEDMKKMLSVLKQNFTTKYPEDTGALIYFDNVIGASRGGRKKPKTKKGKSKKQKKTKKMRKSKRPRRSI